MFLNKPVSWEVVGPDYKFASSVYLGSGRSDDRQVSASKLDLVKVELIPLAEGNVTTTDRKARWKQSDAALD
jgi:hypothetical protein